MTVPLVATQHSAERYEVYYDDSGYYGYVMVGTRASRRRPTRADIDAVKERLRAGGVQPVMAGRSYRPADDGKQYDYYIRVLRNGDKPDRQTVLTALQPNAPAVTPSSPPQVAHPLQEVTEAHDNYCRKCGAPVRGITHPLQEVMEALEQERQEKQAFQQRLQQAEALNSEINSAKTQLEDEITRLREEIRTTTSLVRGKESEEVAYDRLLDEQQEQIKRLVADLESAQSALDRARTDRGNTIAERDYYQGELANLRAENAGLPATSDAPRVNRRVPEEEFEAIIACLLPEIEFMKGSVSVMLTEVRDYTDALNTLKQIAASNATPYRTVQSTPKATWYEYRYSTGSAGRRSGGRIYATKTKDKKHLVLVGTKATQETNIERLKDARP